MMGSRQERRAGPGWRPIGFVACDGATVAVWRVRLPAGFPERLHEDLGGLRRQAAECTAACGGALVDFEQVRVDGRPGLRRVERLSGRAGYAGLLVAVVDGGIAAQITVTCPGDEAALARVRGLLDELTAGIGLVPSSVPGRGHGDLDGEGSPRRGGREDALAAGSGRRPLGVVRG